MISGVFSLIFIVGFVLVLRLENSIIWFNHLVVSHIHKNKTILQLYNTIVVKKPHHFTISTHIAGVLFFVAYCLSAYTFFHKTIHNSANNLVIILLSSIVITAIIYSVTPKFSKKNIVAFLYPFIFIHIVISPLSHIIFITMQFILFCFGIKISKPQSDSAINQNNTSNSNKLENENTDEFENLKLFQNALEFSSLKLRECIVPRTDLITINVTDSIENLLRKFTNSGNSKILVYDDSIDNIIGYVHNSDIFKNPRTIQEIIRKILFVPETMNAKKLLLQLIDDKQSIAVVVDEFGGTAGIVTIEDIIEEILGEIKDEHDTVILEEKILPNSEYIFSGRHEIDYINEKYHLDIPVSEEYETLAGFFLFHHNKFPHINSKLTTNNIKITVLKITGTRIELLHIKIL